MLIHDLDDRGEFGLKGSATDQEAIDVRLSDQVGSVGCVGRAAVLDADAVANLLRGGASKPLPDESVGLLSDLGSGGLSSADSPNWLVRNHDAVPVGDALEASLELLSQHFVGLFGLSLLKGLTAAQDSVESGFLGAEDFLRDDLVGFAEELAALRVANDGPLKAEVLDLLSGDFAGEGTVLGG